VALTSENGLFSRKSFPLEGNEMSANKLNVLLFFHDFGKNNKQLLSLL